VVPLVVSLVSRYQARAIGRTLLPFYRSGRLSDRLLLPGRLVTSGLRGRRGLEVRCSAPCSCRSHTELGLATARFGRIGGLASAFQTPISRPHLPALGHSGHRKQPRDFLAIRGVDAKYVSNGEPLRRPLAPPNLFTRPDTTLDD